MLFLVGRSAMTRPGKTSSGSCMCGFLSTMKGSPHLSLMVCSVSPSPTTYTSSHGFTAAPPSRRPRTSRPPRERAQQHERDERHREAPRRRVRCRRGRRAQLRAPEARPRRRRRCRGGHARMRARDVHSLG